MNKKDIMFDEGWPMANVTEQEWEEVTTVLADIDERKTHYVRPPENHIVIDFDLTDTDGNKSLQLNLEKASIWPSTYAEYSKSGSGIHLHYIYEEILLNSVIYLKITSK